MVRPSLLRGLLLSDPELMKLARAVERAAGKKGSAITHVHRVLEERPVYRALFAQRFAKMGLRIDEDDWREIRMAIVDHVMGAR